MEKAETVENILYHAMLFCKCNFHEYLSDIEKRKEEMLDKQGY